MIYCYQIGRREYRDLVRRIWSLARLVYITLLTMLYDKVRQTRVSCVNLESESLRSVIDLVQPHLPWSFLLPQTPWLFLVESQ